MRPVAIEDERREERKKVLNYTTLRFLSMTAACAGLSLGFAMNAFAQISPQFQVSNGAILKNGVRHEFRGANGMHSFGGDSADMAAWQLDIVREFVDNLKENPLTGAYSVQSSTGAWLQPLQKIVNANRANGKVTILCAFGWDGTEATKFIGLNPSQTPFWNDYKTRFRAVANQFKNQSDVWFEVWNEPYYWDRTHGYSDALWLSDMKLMVDNIRSTGATNIILVPGAESGQDEKVILNQGALLLKGRSNIVFDVHAYEKWLFDSQATIEARIRQLNKAGFAVLFGETAPRNAGALMNPLAFLMATKNTKTSVCAWLWKWDGNDQDALLNANGTAPNDNNNNSWGSTFKAYALSPRL